MESLKNKVALITGASGDYGRATAVYFAKYGAKLALTGRTETKLDQTISLCKKENPDVEIIKIVGDITERAFQKKLVDEIINHFGRLNILINNAGQAQYGNFTEVTEEAFDKVMDINMKSIFFLTQLCVPHLIAQKGSIVNVSSVYGIKPAPIHIAYCMSKSALDHFTRCLALDLADKQVRVNSLNSGHVQTNLLETSGLSMGKEKDDLFWQSMAPVYPIKRIGTLDEIAQSIGYLASDMSSFTTGHQLVCAGGHQL